MTKPILGASGMRIQVIRWFLVFGYDEEGELSIPVKLRCAVVLMFHICRGDGQEQARYNHPKNRFRILFQTLKTGTKNEMFVEEK